MPALSAAAARAEQEFRAIDILFANAGIQAFKPLLERDDADWQVQIDNNLTGTARGEDAAVSKFLHPPAAFRGNNCNAAARRRTTLPRPYVLTRNFSMTYAATVRPPRGLGTAVAPYFHRSDRASRSGELNRDHTPRADAPARGLRSHFPLFTLIWPPCCVRVIGAPTRPHAGLTPPRNSPDPSTRRRRSNVAGVFFW
jgi:short chain dehydrogenase